MLGDRLRPTYKCSYAVTLAPPIRFQIMPAKKNLREDRKFRLLFQDHPQPMWLFDAESRKLIEANEAAVKLYGYTADEMRSMPMDEFQATGDLERFLSQRT